jgi:hypothetical protein
MNKYNQIIINSMPRSGSTWSQYLLAKSINRKDGNPIDSDIQSFNTSPIPGDNNFVMRSNNIIGLYGKYDTIKQVTILRSPKDVIPSVITKTYGGAGDTVSNGVVIPAEIPDFNMDEHIYAQIQIYKGYAKAALDNFKNLNVFTFDQVTSDINFFTETMLGKDLSLENKYYDQFLQKAKKEIRVHPLSHPGYTNAVPEEKPKIYNKAKLFFTIKENLEKDHFLEISEMYNEIASMCKKFENDFKGLKSF